MPTKTTMIIIIDNASITQSDKSRESSECTEHSQDQMSQINTGKTVYVGNA